MHDGLTQMMAMLWKWGNMALFSIGSTPVSLLSLVGLVLILFMAWWISAKLENWIQHLLIGRHKGMVDDSTVYALTRLIRYGVWFGGTMIGLSWLGFNLSNMALIGGAIGVGIGFGLQNIFSNFVSGIILIFERTLKVGDFVELQSGVNGKVSEIALRYTRVSTPDNVDVIVPNSEFINGKVINWSYNEKNRRIHVPFGVAYGSDKERVREAATVAAKSIANTITDDTRHPIEVWLVGFGDSSLNFELVVWVDHELMTRPARTQAQYLWAIETELRKRHIEIPFPQRDLHVRSGTLNVSIQDRGGPPTKA
jgi:small-conductance mechanosensitive channel